MSEDKAYQSLFCCSALTACTLTPHIQAGDILVSINKISLISTEVDVSSPRSSEKFFDYVTNTIKLAKFPKKVRFLRLIRPTESPAAVNSVFEIKLLPQEASLLLNTNQKLGISKFAVGKIQIGTTFGPTTSSLFDVTFPYQQSLGIRIWPYKLYYSGINVQNTNNEISFTSEGDDVEEDIMDLDVDEMMNISTFHTVSSANKRIGRFDSKQEALTRSRSNSPKKRNKSPLLEADRSSMSLDDLKKEDTDKIRESDFNQKVDGQVEGRRSSCVADLVLQFEDLSPGGPDSARREGSHKSDHRSERSTSLKGTSEEGSDYNVNESLNLPSCNDVDLNMGEETPGSFTSTIEMESPSFPESLRKDFLPFQSDISSFAIGNLPISQIENLEERKSTHLLEAEELELQVLGMDEKVEVQRNTMSLHDLMKENKKYMSLDDILKENNYEISDKSALIIDKIPEKEVMVEDEIPESDSVAKNYNRVEARRTSVTNLILLFTDLYPSREAARKGSTFQYRNNTVPGLAKQFEEGLVHEENFASDNDDDDDDDDETSEVSSKVSDRESDLIHEITETAPATLLETSEEEECRIDIVEKTRIRTTVGNMVARFNSTKKDDATASIQESPFFPSESVSSSPWEMSSQAATLPWSARHKQSNSRIVSSPWSTQPVRQVVTQSFIPMSQQTSMTVRTIPPATNFRKSDAILPDIKPSESVTTSQELPESARKKSHRRDTLKSKAVTPAAWAEIERKEFETNKNKADLIPMSDSDMPGELKLKTENADLKSRILSLTISLTGKDLLEIELESIREKLHLAETELEQSKVTLEENGKLWSERLTYSMQKEYKSDLQSSRKETTTPEKSYYNGQMFLSHIDSKEIQNEVIEAGNDFASSASSPSSRRGSVTATSYQSEIDLVTDARIINLKKSHINTMKSIQEAESHMKQQIVAFIADFDHASIDSTSIDMVVEDFLCWKGVAINHKRAIDLLALQNENKKLSDEIFCLHELHLKLGLDVLVTGNKNDVISSIPGMIQQNKMKDEYHYEEKDITIDADLESSLKNDSDERRVRGYSNSSLPLPREKTTPLGSPSSKPSKLNPSVSSKRLFRNLNPMIMASFFLKKNSGVQPVIEKEEKLIVIEEKIKNVKKLSKDSIDTKRFSATEASL